MTSPSSWAALPDTIWFSHGLGVVDGGVSTIEARLCEQLGDSSTREWARHDLDDGKTVFDALWEPEPDVLVRARLQISPHEPGMWWGVVAEATVPWNWSWPSPALLFFPRSRTSLWDGVQIPDLVNLFGAGLEGEPYSFRRANTVRFPGSVKWVVKAALAAGTEIHVLTTDDDPPVPPVIPLVRFLPGSFTGRVVEHRVAPRAVDALNTVLAAHGLRLPDRGALVLPQRLRATADEAAALTVPGLNWAAGRPAALVEAVVRHAARPRLAPPTAHHAVAELRRTFTVATDAEALDELEGELQATQTTLEQANATASAAVARAAELQRAVTAAEAAERAAKARADELAAELARREEAARAARAEARRLRAAAAKTALGRALHEEQARREAAESNLAAAEDLLDEQAREINWLRGRLRAAGEIPQPETAAPREVDVPGSWEELQQRVGRELDHVVLGDITATARSLRGHPLDPRWRARAWQALLVLDAYARAAVEHGPDLLPHLSAYLDWHQAPLVMPRTWYVPTESREVMTSPRLRGERTFPVPREADPAGRVLMAEHIRIGSGQPPAPRMHLHDATARLGRVYVGYIGAHRKNRATN